MRHHNVNRKLGLKRKGRRALLKSMASSLILREKIVTTEAKAKELRPYVEKIISKSRDGAAPSRRLIASKLGKNRITDKLFKSIASRYQDRAGGYTRITKLPRRQSDGSKMAQIELV
jgi:large subunit ribosomal protein L17